MRHGKKFNHLGRKKAHRHALLRNLTISLVEHKRINTTLAKAKALRRFVEPIVTKSKLNTTHSRRVVFSYLQNKETVTELFDTIATKVASRAGGYLRIIKMGFRKSDGAEMAMIEFVDFNEVYTKRATSGSSAEGKSKKKRTRRGKKKEAGAAAVAAAATTEVADDVASKVEEKKQEEE